MRREHSDGWRSDSTGKIVLLTYSLTASHCSTEAHLAGVSFPCSFDLCLALRQSCSARLVLRLNKVIFCQEKGDKNSCFEQVIKLRSVVALLHG